MARHEAPKKPNLNKPCCVCGETIRSGTYHEVGPPGCRARGHIWPEGLYTHVRCRVGTKRWYESLGKPVKGFARLFHRASDSLHLRLFEGVQFKTPTLDEAKEPHEASK